MGCVTAGVPLRLVNFTKTNANQLDTMDRTTYSFIPTRELTVFALSRDSRTELEIELAQRLELALDMIEEDDDS